MQNQHLPSPSLSLLFLPRTPPPLGFYLFTARHKPLVLRCTRLNKCLFVWKHRWKHGPPSSPKKLTDIFISLCLPPLCLHLSIPHRSPPPTRKTTHSFLLKSQMLKCLAAHQHRPRPTSNTLFLFLPPPVTRVFGEGDLKNGFLG
jgi:hypothetical protein